MESLGTVSSGYVSTSILEFAHKKVGEEGEGFRSTRLGWTHLRLFTKLYLMEIDVGY